VIEHPRTTRVQTRGVRPGDLEWFPTLPLFSTPHLSP